MPKISHKQKSRKHRNRRTKKYTRKQKGGAGPTISHGISRKGFGRAATKHRKLPTAGVATKNTNDGPLPAIPFNSLYNNVEPFAVANPNPNSLYTPMAPGNQLYENSKQFTNGSEKAARIKELEKENDDLIREWSNIRPQYLNMNYANRASPKIIYKSEKDNKEKRELLLNKLQDLEKQMDENNAELKRLQESNS